MFPGCNMGRISPVYRLLYPVKTEEFAVKEVTEILALPIGLPVAWSTTTALTYEVTDGLICSGTLNSYKSKSGDNAVKSDTKPSLLDAKYPVVPL